MPMVTTRIKEAVPIIMPSAVSVKRTLLLQNVSKEKLRISPKAIRGRSRSGMRAAAISVRCYVQRERGASARSGGQNNRKSQTRSGLLWHSYEAQFLGAEAQGRSFD